MVNEFEKLDRKQKAIVHLAPFAAGGGERGKVDGVRSCISLSLLAFQTDSPTAQGHWGLSQTVELVHCRDAKPLLACLVA